MKLTLWNPKENVNLLDEFDRFVPRIINECNNFFTHDDWNWTPTADIVEKENEYEIKTELPGVKKKEIQVTFNEGILTIKGERKHTDKKKKNGEYIYREIFEGSFERNFRFTDNIQDDKITAEYKNGVLTVTVPKSEKAKTQSIEIK